MANWYVRDTGALGYSAVPKWAATTVYGAGAIVRQLATPSVGGERCFRTVAGGTSGAAEPVWVLTKGSSSPLDGSVTWVEVTGNAVFNGDGGGTAWGAPSARVEMFGSAGWGANTAGDNIFLANDHAQTQTGALSISPTSAATAVTVIACIAANSPMPPISYSTGASVTTTGTTANMTFGSAAFNCYLNGITFSVGAGSAAAVSIIFGSASAQFSFVGDNLTFNLNSTGGASRINGAGSARTSYIKLRNPTFTAAAVTHAISIGMGYAEFIGGSYFVTGSKPTVAFVASAALTGKAIIRDTDLSVISGTLVNVAALATIDHYFENCKISGSVALTTNNFPCLGSFRIRMQNTDSTNTNYNMIIADYSGTLRDSPTTYRANGASDGTTSISWQMISTANCAFNQPFISEEITVWNNKISALTATLNLTSSVNLTNAMVGIEWEYPGSSQTPIGTTDLTTIAPNNLATPVALTSDTISTWIAGLGKNYQISATLTPQMAGPIKARIYILSPSLTINIDPLLVLV